MRSLATKLTLAFLLVGVLGVLLFALLVGRQTRTEFNRFLSTRDQEILVDTLTDYATRRGSWEGLATALDERPALIGSVRAAVLTDPDGDVLIGNPAFPPGSRVSAATLAAATAIVVERSETAQGNSGETQSGEAQSGAREIIAGYVFFPPPPAHTGARVPSPMESAFLRRVVWAALLSGIATVLVALVVGGVLARTLTRPLTALTAATRAMARGDLQQQVEVQAQDEIGELALSFNQMSSDLARASHTRKQMTADLAHDLRTPLSILRGYTEGLKDGRIDGSPMLYALLFDEVLHLQRLVEDLRVLSLADAGELPLNRRTVDPAALLERAGLLYLPAAQARGLDLRVEAFEGLPSIQVDTDRMAQVLNNLLSNALRHTAQGSILLRATADDGHVRIEVRDTGSGVAPDDLPFVFDRFYRGDPARRRPSAGGEGGPDDTSSGLGLAIAKAIVETHGGTIAVASTPGEGTTFTILLPAVAVATG